MQIYFKTKFKIVITNIKQKFISESLNKNNFEKQPLAVKTDSVILLSADNESAVFLELPVCYQLIKQVESSENGLVHVETFVAGQPTWNRIMIRLDQFLTAVSISSIT